MTEFVPYSKIELYNEIAGDNINYVRNYYDTYGNAEVNTIDDEGFTPLEWAVDQGRLEIIKLLIERGANVNFHVNNEENVGTPALVIACNFFNWNPRLYIKIIILLIEHGANLNQVDPETRQTARDILRNSLQQLNINGNVENIDDLKRIQREISLKPFRKIVRKVKVNNRIVGRNRKFLENLTLPQSVSKSKLPPNVIDQISRMTLFGSRSNKTSLKIINAEIKYLIRL